MADTSATPPVQKNRGNAAVTRGRGGQESFDAMLRRFNQDLMKNRVRQRKNASGIQTRKKSKLFQKLRAAHGGMLREASAKRNWLEGRTKLA